MKGNTNVIAVLNKVLYQELISINQYFLHARMFRYWGLEELNEKEYKKSIKDMKQADDLIERILFLEGVPNLQDLGRLRIGENTEEMLKCDFDLEMEQITLMRDAVVLCEQQEDYVSREILVDILAYEESHVDWIEAQQFLIGNTGIQNYQQSMMND